MLDQLEKPDLGDVKNIARERVRHDGLSRVIYRNSRYPEDYFMCTEYRWQILRTVGSTSYVERVTINGEG